MTDNDLINIALATYNGERFIQQQLDSISEQTHKNFIIHLCDDGSKDDTLMVVKAHPLYQQGKIIIHPGKGGLGALRNFDRAISLCDAPYIALCDQDDYWHPEKLSALLVQVKKQELISPTEAILAFSDLEIVNETLGRIAPSFYRSSIKSSKAVNPEDFLVSNHIPGCVMLFNRQLKQLFEPIPKRIRMHDWWIAMIAASCGVICYIDRPLIKYRQHGNNTVGVPGMARRRILPDSLLCLRGFSVTRKRTAVMREELAAFYHRHKVKTDYFRPVIDNNMSFLNKLNLMYRARNGERKTLSYLIWWTL
ncbi:glycosyltransferase family 2 protein [Brenneria populi]|uniref:Glycosyltransferase family 2 protein n=1 Tax=Brenneria populi TaxID=1505588 RepID=A0ABU6JNL3_9GAMM|nr:glycosyltransferase family 2 protein [Brenneria populi Li et al. 2015]